MGEKLEAGKWFLLIVIGLLVITAIGYALRPIDKMVERKVLIESHQYKQGMNERVAMFESALIEIDARLTSSVDAQTRSNLEAQRSALNAQLNAARKVQ